MKTGVEKLLDSTIRAQVNLDRYGQGLSKKIVDILRKAEKEMVDAILIADPTAPRLTKWKKRRLMKLRKRVSKDILGPRYSQIKQVHLEELNRLATIEHARTIKAVNNAIGVNIFDVTLTQRNLKSIATNTMIDGQIVGGWWKEKEISFRKDFGKQMADAMQKVELGLVSGESVGELVKRVKETALFPGMMKSAKHQATALVRTSVMSVASETRKELYKANEDLINGYEVVATLDKRTTPLCRALDGKHYTIDFKPIGHDFDYPGGPPFHWQCRTAIVPLLKGYDELAGPESKLSRKQLKELNKLDKTQRVSISYIKDPKGIGQPVSANLTYDSWLKKQPKVTQLDILGPGRYKLWKENNLSMSDLVNNAGRTLTLDELAGVEGVEKDSL